MSSSLAPAPACIVAGDTVRWHCPDLPEHASADGWHLHYLLACAKQQVTLLATTNAGGGWDVHATASATADWTPGTWSWAARIEKDGEIHTVSRGELTVSPSLAQPVDTRSPARRALEAVEAYLANPDNLECASYTIKGRQLSRYPLPELWQHRDRLRAEVARENAAARTRAGLGPVGRIQVRW